MLGTFKGFLRIYRPVCSLKFFHRFSFAIQTDFPQIVFIKHLTLNSGLNECRIHVFLYNHNIYKHNEAQISKKTNHILSIFLSLILSMKSNSLS